MAAIPHQQCDFLEAAPHLETAHRIETAHSVDSCSVSSDFNLLDIDTDDDLLHVDSSDEEDRDNSCGISIDDCLDDTCIAKSDSAISDSNPLSKRSKWLLKHLSGFPCTTLTYSRFRVLRRVCRKGLQPERRGEFWHLLASRLSSGTEALQLCKDSTIVNLEQREAEEYSRCMRVNPDPRHSDLILKDLPRCMPNHPKFEEKLGAGQAALNKVLFAYSVYNPQIGYCQGMGPLVAFLLTVMEMDKSFWVLHYLLSDLRYMKDYNTVGLQGVIVDLWLYELILKHFMPKHYKVLKKCDYDAALYAQSWFFCLFVRTLPNDLVLRIWDMYLCEGKFVMFKAALVIVKITFQNEAKSIQRKEYDSLIVSLQRPPDDLFEKKQFLREMAKIKISARMREKFTIKAERHREELFGVCYEDIYTDVPCIVSKSDKGSKRSTGSSERSTSLPRPKKSASAGPQEAHSDYGSATVGGLSNPASPSISSNDSAASNPVSIR